MKQIKLRTLLVTLSHRGNLSRPRPPGTEEGVVTVRPVTRHDPEVSILLKLDTWVNFLLFRRLLYDDHDGCIHVVFLYLGIFG